MKAAMIIDEKKMVVKEIETPKPDGYHVLMKVTNVGICGSDIHFWELGGLDMYKNTIPGHEHAGIVVDPGKRTDLKPGDRITSIPYSSACKKCTACLEEKYSQCRNKKLAPGNWPSSPGTYAEYFMAEPEHVRKIPDSMSDEEASMVEPAATPYAALKDMGVNTGDRILISGGGIIGSLCAAWAKYFGAEYVAMTEVNEFRKQKALKDGYVDEVFDGRDPDIVKKLIIASKSDGLGFKYFAECSGNGAALKVGMAACRMSAKVAVIGVSAHDVPFSIISAILKRLEFKAYLAYSIEEYDEVFNLIAQKKFDVMKQYTKDVALEEAEDTYRWLQDPACTDVKVMIKFK